MTDGAQSFDIDGLFAKSFEALLGVIGSKRKALVAQQAPAHSAVFPVVDSAIAARIDAFEKAEVPRRIWARDPTVWQDDPNTPEIRDRLALRVNRENLGNVAVRLGLPEDPRLPAASFDRIFLVHMYHEVDRPYEFLWNLRQGLKPGGLVVVVDADRPVKRHGTPPAVLDCETASVGLARVREEPLEAADGYWRTLGTPISRDELQPGDLIFYYSPISHVSVYIGGGQRISATHTGDYVRQVVKPTVQQAPGGIDGLAGGHAVTLLGTDDSKAQALAGELGLSEATVKTHVGRLLGKLDVRSRVQAVVLAYESGFVRPGHTDEADL